MSEQAAPYPWGELALALWLASIIGLLSANAAMLARDDCFFPAWTVAQAERGTC